MSIRAVFATMALILVIAAAAAVTALAGLIIHDREAATSWSASARSTRAAEELELNLLRLSRARSHPHNDGNVTDADLSRLERTLAADADAERQTARTDTERKLAAAADSAIRAYAVAPGDPAVLEQRLPDALGRVGALVAYNTAGAEAADALISGRHRAAANFAGTAAVLLVLGVAATLIALQRTAVRPLSHLRSCLEDFANGQETVRAPCVGPAEARAIATSFNSMADRLVAHRSRERTLIAGVAHDLRTPLHALRMAAEVADREDTWIDVAHARNLTRLIARQITSLERMASDLLDDAMLQSGRLTLQQSLFDIRQVAESVVDLFRAQATTHQIHLASASEPVWVAGDVGRIQQVLTNLVSNGIKYSPVRSAITVAIAQDVERATVQVTDEGPGIPRSEQRHVFDAFKRGTAHANTTPGAGLGLALASRIVAAHHGTIGVSSGPGGTTFTVTLPLAAAAHDAASL